MSFLGIDPGLTGAAVVIGGPSNRDIIAVFDPVIVQVVRGGKKRSEYVIPAMADFIKLHAPYEAAVIESVSAMPGQGVSSVFAFGRGLGIWEGILSALQVPYTKVHPATWKKAMQVGSDKSSCLVRAGQLFPGYGRYFQRAKDEGRGEACLMAVHAARMLGLKAEDDNF